MACAALRFCLFFEHPIIPCVRMVINDGHTVTFTTHTPLLIDSLPASLTAWWPHPNHERRLRWIAPPNPSRCLLP
jgi:hypothetical protein